MANANTPYIAKAAAPLVNPTGVAQPFVTALSNIATVASTQVQKPAYVKYATYAQGGSGVSNNINYVKIAVRLGGRVMAGASTTFVPSIAVAASSQVPPTVISLGTGTQVLGALTAATYTATGVWTLDATLVWDYASGLISGTFNGNQTPSSGTPTPVVTAAQAVTPAQGYTIVPPLTNLPANAAQAAAQVNNGGELPLFFVAYGIFGTSNAGNMAYLDDFEVEVL